jgi:hypothetical protein
MPDSDQILQRSEMSGRARSGCHPRLNPFMAYAFALFSRVTQGAGEYGDEKTSKAGISSAGG